MPARRGSIPYLKRSLLDRLVAAAPAGDGPVRNRRGLPVEVLDSLLRDLENLLNTRRSIPLAPDRRRQSQNSILSYGTRDFSTHNPRTAVAREQIRLEIQRLLLSFEPRLREVVVRVDDLTDAGRTLQFRVEGLLLIEPHPSPVTFATCFDINSGAYSVFK
ncbi:T6SS lysozyme-like component TssE [Citrifermentans bremense]|uniref:T6SS lysozyme-like component TssE n=1 Tax=Citrifermentans bremense TaxID=60035 RepID=A0A6S6M421_9BACT|nr:type VI secretion system baseplate subunit TssE [Citrifermentans bremense]BCG46411.1 T6SS lysozyme-like component TssE [Citrifermentans bremense]